MNTLIAKSSVFKRLAENMSLALRRPPRRQVAALCYREGKKGPEVLLVTSRSTKRWIIPKGWPMAEHSARKTAKIEAYEEAGVIGKPAKKALGEFPSRKGVGNGFRVRTSITVYPLKVEKQIKKFPEKGERELAWLPLKDAIERCTEDGLRELLRTDDVKTLLTDIK